MKEILRPTFSILAVFTVGLGLAYPAAVTGFAQLVFPRQANGSIVSVDGRPVGSVLVGQEFKRPEYFWGRPSATSPRPYNAAASAGSNLGPANPALREAVGARISALRAADAGNRLPIPVDLVTASASGLDPDISPAAAHFQVPRVAGRRGLEESAVHRLVESHVKGGLDRLWGGARVNVLLLNLDLDRMESGGGR